MTPVELQAARRRTVYRDPPENLLTPRQILDLRRRLGLTQLELAERIGASLDTIRSWETGRRHPTGCARRALQDLAAVENLA